MHIADVRLAGPCLGSEKDFDGLGRDYVFKLVRVSGHGIALGACRITCSQFSASKAINAFLLSRVCGFMFVQLQAERPTHF